MKILTAIYSAKAKPLADVEILPYIQNILDRMSDRQEITFSNILVLYTIRMLVLNRNDIKLFITKDNSDVVVECDQYMMFDNNILDVPNLVLDYSMKILFDGMEKEESDKGILESNDEN